MDLTALLKTLAEAVERYEESAPTVSAHCDDVYRRISRGGRDVSLWELLQVAALWADGGWMHPNYAANHVYKLRNALKMDTTGHAGF